jgi:hypothetical protein
MSYRLGISCHLGMYYRIDLCRRLEDSESTQIHALEDSAGTQTATDDVTKIVCRDAEADVPKLRSSRDMDVLETLARLFVKTLVMCRYNQVRHLLAILTL